jgi:hypothetical protein
MFKKNVILKNSENFSESSLVPFDRAGDHVYIHQNLADAP